MNTETTEFDPICHCQNCPWTGSESLTCEIKDVRERVMAGEPMPPGECPECGSLCQYPDHTQPGDVWSYDSAERRLHDENGLTVAENVGPQDAALILASRFTRPAIAEIIASMLAYDAELFDAEPEHPDHYPDLEVDGDDLRDAFGEWREKLKEAMASPAAPAPSAYAAKLRTTYGLKGTDAEVLEQWDRVMSNPPPKRDGFDMAGAARQPGRTEPA